VSKRIVVNADGRPIDRHFEASEASGVKVRRVKGFEMLWLSGASLFACSSEPVRVDAEPARNFVLPVLAPGDTGTVPGIPSPGWVYPAKGTPLLQIIGDPSSIDGADFDEMENSDRVYDRNFQTSFPCPKGSFFCTSSRAVRVFGDGGTTEAMPSFTFSIHRKVICRSPIDSDHSRK
jgi:hypothetical protein